METTGRHKLSTTKKESVHPSTRFNTFLVCPSLNPKAKMYLLWKVHSGLGWKTTFGRGTDFSHTITTDVRKTKSTSLDGPVVLIRRVLLQDSFLSLDCSTRREWTTFRRSITHISVVGMRMTLNTRTGH